MKIKVADYKLAADIGISGGHLSTILNDKVPVGKLVAKRFAEYTGRRWVTFMDMNPKKIGAVLRGAFFKKHYPRSTEGHSCSYRVGEKAL